MPQRFRHILRVTEVMFYINIFKPSVFCKNIPCEEGPLFPDDFLSIKIAGLDQISDGGTVDNLD